MAGAKKVPVVNVTVGETTYPAGKDLPAGVADQIDNPKVWETPKASGADALDGEPPRSGQGSGVDAWRDYAEASGIDVPEGASRDDIVELVDQAKA